jgi:ArsR family transcriptional regulator, arsenate/arsenite/antimonite-responsive transcriptional repressor
MKTADPDPYDRDLAHICKALGSPVRVQIMRYVLTHPGCIGNEILLHMPDDGPHAQSTISQHLRVLREVGLLEAQGDGPAVCYWVNATRLTWLRAQLGDFQNGH